MDLSKDKIKHPTSNKYIDSYDSELDVLLESRYRELFGEEYLQEDLAIIDDLKVNQGAINRI